MAFLKRLFGGGQQSQDSNILHLHVKCGRCGTPVHVRINLSNDLIADYGDTAAEGYELHKDVMDDRCFRLMRAHLTFDSRRRETSRAVEGGEFISAEDYEALTAARAAPRAES
jgi:hypothetical protein